MRLAIGAILRNEAPYILEWIAWHRMLGIKDFYLCDNDSDDGSTELLAALDRAGVIRHIPFPDIPGQRPQMRAYAHLLEAQSAGIDWMALIDLDEFIQMTGDLSLEDCLRKQSTSVGAVLMSWASFGSSGLEDADDPFWPTPSVERFLRRAPQSAALNRDVKSFVRPEAVALDRAAVGDPHRLPLLLGYRYARPKEAIFGPQAQDEQHSEVDWSVLRLNHYVVRSRAEYLLKKLARGDVLRELARPYGHFNKLNRNEIFDPPGPEVLARLRVGIDELKTLIDPGWRPAPIPTLGEPHRGVDGLYWDRDRRCFILDGYFLDHYGVATINQMGIGLGFGAQALRPGRIELFEHPSGSGSRAHGQLMSGFRAWFAYPEGEVPVRVHLLSGYDPLGAFVVTELASDCSLPALVLA